MQWGQLSQRATWPSSSTSLGWGLVGPSAAVAVSVVDAADVCPPVAGVEDLSADDSLILVPDAGAILRSADAHGNGLSRLADTSAEAEPELIIPSEAIRVKSEAQSAVGEPMGMERRRENGLIEWSSEDETQWPDRGGQAEASSASGHTDAAVEPFAGSNQQLQVATELRSNGTARPAEGVSSGSECPMSVSAAEVLELCSSRSSSSMPQQTAGTVEGAAQRSAPLRPASNGQAHPLQQSRLECNGIEGLLADKSMPMTARGIVSEWLASGHEVVTVRL